MPYYCTVPRCTSMAGKAKNVSFHQFPRDEELAKLWNRILKRGKPYTKYSKVCSLHFTADDYTITSGQKNKVHLYRNCSLCSQRLFYRVMCDLWGYLFPMEQKAPQVLRVLTHQSTGICQVWMTKQQYPQGQWRTLRKDAIPSQNLPSDSPMPYQRRSSWTPPPTTVDTKMHQQMAQAIYVQTMLAMQAAGITGSINKEPTPELMEDSESTSTLHNLTQFEQIFSENEHTDAHTLNDIPTDTFRCTQCSKYFKDPDVFLLHKRIHTNEDTEEMLRANPILAGLLKSQANSNIDIKNVKSIENQIMTALAANMENYLRNLSTIMTHGNPDAIESSSFENGTLDSQDCIENSNYENVKLNSDVSNFDNGILDSHICDNKDFESSDSNLVIDEDAC